MDGVDFTCKACGTFKKVVKKRSTENFKGLPYVCTLLSTCLWTFYGLLKPDGLLIATVNGAGAALEAIYVTLFIIFAPKDAKVKMIKLVTILNVGLFGAVIVVALFAIHGSVRLTMIGFMCAGLTLGMYGSPMAAMRMVIVTKSVDYMPFFLSFFLFLNGAVWTAYAILVKDYFVGVPNAIGFVMGSAQLAIYTIYRSRRSTTKTSHEKEVEEGSAHLVKGLEMQLHHENEAAADKGRILDKGRSLPKTSVSRQLSFQKIVKSLSLT
ncbi:bidirectional sugar transporter SWEET16-like isoform X2 [Magnolia sinica]|uniref:bidirectional sugar transporter SWEET16-like isoform X2 n=1 Tax=Magnolia sinica TaxID=86752 RepID=UPI00265AECAF|nr:bidirectional sugar transporter SWEET16-like isoform X2 [Magnolia sinica]